MKRNRSAFDRIINFRRMKTKHRRISVRSDSSSFISHAKCMSRVINHFQTIFFCNSFNFLNITYVSINMNRNNCRCPIRDQTFQLFHIDCIIFRINITKYRCKTISHNRVSCRCKCKRSCNYLS